MKKIAGALLLILTLMTLCAPLHGATGGAFSALAEEEDALKLGMQDNWRDKRVHALQDRLAELGYFEGKSDGYFGYSTRNALRDFQEDQGMEPTGRLDDATRYWLYPDYRAMVDATNETLTTLENCGGSVEKVQQALGCYGFYETAPSGEFDEATMEAVARFQAYAVAHYGPAFAEPLARVADVLPNGNDDGSADSAVDPADGSADDPADEPADDPAGAEAYAVDGGVDWDLYNYLVFDRFPVYARDAAPGDSGDEVRRAQRRLATLGFYYDDITGEFDDPTRAALIAFQGHSGLPETGAADEDTQRLMYSRAAVGLEDVDMPFYIKVSLEDQRVYIYRWMDGEYSYLLKTMICSTGAERSPTPKGIFESEGQMDGQWHHFYGYDCWGQYPFGIVGNIWFHSVLYSQKDESTIRQLSVDQLGTPASSGCVRLMTPEAKWIYEHCEAGQLVEVY